ncbi:MAG: hypothetical protein WD181_02950 [Solirubrobacterales bacterium]
MENLSRSRLIRALLATTLVAFSGFVLVACGSGGGEEGSGGEEIEVVIEGEAVEVEPFQYNVLFTRPLNRFDVEDREYLEGQPPPKPGETYIGVFVKMANIDDVPHAIPESFEIVDTADRRHESIESDSIYALPGGTILEPGDEFPEIDSTAQVGPIQASMLLFKVPDEVLELRPVELELQGEEERAAVELDL